MKTVSLSDVEPAPPSPPQILRGKYFPNSPGPQSNTFKIEKYEENWHVKFVLNLQPLPLHNKRLRIWTKLICWALLSHVWFCPASPTTQQQVESMKKVDILDRCFNFTSPHSPAKQYYENWTNLTCQDISNILTPAYSPRQRIENFHKLNMVFQFLPPPPWKQRVDLLNLTTAQDLH